MRNRGLPPGQALGAPSLWARESLEHPAAGSAGDGALHNRRATQRGLAGSPIRIERTNGMAMIFHRSSHFYLKQRMTGTEQDVRASVLDASASKARAAMRRFGVQYMR